MIELFIYACDHRFLFFVPAIIFGILAVVAAISNEKKSQRQAKTGKWIELYDKSDALSSPSAETVSQYIDNCEEAFREVEPYADANMRSMHRENMALARDQLHDVEMEQWARKAEKHLQRFYESYCTVINGELNNFQDVERLMKEKSRCIREWQNYYAIDLEPYRTTIYPKQYMREYLGDDYDPCMESHAALEKKLDEYVALMRPEQKRKNKLYESIVEYVRARNTVPRSDLLKIDFAGFTPEEVKCCYHELIKKNRLVQTKVGSRLFVSLSDKELSNKKHTIRKEHQTAKREAPSADLKMSSAPQSSPSNSAAYRAAIDLLRSKNEEYVDKVSKGGCLYFFSKDIADTLKKNGHKVSFAQHGTKSTSYRKAWYVK